MIKRCLLWFLLSSLYLYTCTTETQQLPILSYTINAEGKKTHYTIEYSGFKNQLSQDFTSQHLNNKIVITNFFFTRCPSICPPMRQQLINIANTIKSDDFLIVSHTVDPENDTPDILKTYAENTGIADSKWQFLTAPEAIIKKHAKQYMTNFKPNKDGTDFYHSSYVALLDKKRMIRGFYNILVPEEVERLKNDILQII